MLVLATVLQHLNLTGGAVGALILGAGIGTEGLMAYITGRNIGKELPESDGEAITTTQAMVFFLPLALASVTNTFIRPVINAGLARTADPSLALASYQIAWSFSYIFVAVAFNVHQLVIVFAREAEHRISVLKFSLLMGSLGTVILFIVSVTPLGTMALTRMIGVPPELAVQALRAIALLSLMPILTCISEYCAGLLIIAGQTKYLTAGKAVNVVTILITSLLIARFAPHVGGLLAGICMVSGIAMESIFLAIQTQNISPVWPTITVGN